jgi:arsenate reductase
MLQVLHNPRCGKSRNCLAFLNESNKAFKVIHYLETPPTVEELKILLKKLQLSPIELVRQKEALWITQYKTQSLSEEAIIAALAEHPILIERPIVINGNSAIIGRELEKLERFL